MLTNPKKLLPILAALLLFPRFGWGCDVFETSNVMTSKKTSRSMIDIIHQASVIDEVRSNDHLINKLDAIVGQCYPVQNTPFPPHDSAFTSIVRKNIDESLRKLAPEDRQKNLTFGNEAISDSEIHDIAAFARTIYGEMGDIIARMKIEKENKDKKSRKASLAGEDPQALEEYGEKKGVPYLQAIARVIVNRKETPLGCSERSTFDRPEVIKAIDEPFAPFSSITVNPSQFNCWMPSRREAQDFVGSHPGGGRQYGRNKNSGYNHGYELAMCPPTAESESAPGQDLVAMQAAWRESLQLAKDAVLEPQKFDQTVLPNIKSRYFTSGIPPKASHLKELLGTGFEPKQLRLWDEDPKSYKKNPREYYFCTNQSAPEKH